MEQYSPTQSRPFDYKHTMTEEQALEAFKEGSLFGMVECDIEVPDQLKLYLAEMTLIFKSIKISREDSRQPMKEHAQANKLILA